LLESNFYCGHCDPHPAFSKKMILMIATKPEYGRISKAVTDMNIILPIISKWILT
jgi:hypothetical protein